LRLGWAFRKVLLEPGPNSRMEGTGHMGNCTYLEGGRPTSGQRCCRHPKVRMAWSRFDPTREGAF
jgi:hypothetical protein